MEDQQVQTSNLLLAYDAKSVAIEELDTIYKTLKEDKIIDLKNVKRMVKDLKHFLSDINTQ